MHHNASRCEPNDFTHTHEELGSKFLATQDGTYITTLLGVSDKTKNRAWAAASPKDHPLMLDRRVMALKAGFCGVRHHNKQQVKDSFFEIWLIKYNLRPYRRSLPSVVALIKLVSTLGLA